MGNIGEKIDILNARNVFLRWDLFLTLYYSDLIERTRAKNLSDNTGTQTAFIKKKSTKRML